MRLAEVLSEDCMMADLKAREKKEVLGEMVSAFATKFNGADSASVLKALLEREKLGTTGIGHGVAIPHGKIKGLNGIKVFFGRSRKGVNFDSMDNMPVYLFFMIVAPENSAAAHLKLLASISHLLKHQDIRLKLMRAADCGELYRTILEAERKLGAI